MKNAPAGGEPGGGIAAGRKALSVYRGIGCLISAKSGKNTYSACDFISQHLAADIRQGALLPLVPQHQQQALQQGAGLGVEDVVVLAVGVVLPRGGVGVALLLVGLAGRHPVAEHLHHVPHRHLHAAHAVVQRLVIVDPVLQVVLVAALVVEPGGGHAGGQPLRLVGAAVPLEVPRPHQKLPGPIFAQIVEQALTVQPHPEAQAHHPRLVGGDGFQMSPPLSHGYSL